jgi:hypothetical protein
MVEPQSYRVCKEGFDFGSRRILHRVETTATATKAGLRVGRIPMVGSRNVDQHLVERQ